MNLKTVDFKAVAAKGCYVYAYLREHDLTPYYVGIASDGRRPIHWDHSCQVPTNRSLIRVLKSSLTVDEARSYEKFFIARYKRIVDGGILENKALGGQGAYGAKWSQQTIKEVMNGRHGKRWEIEAEKAGVPLVEWQAMGANERKLVKHFLASNSTKKFSDYKAQRQCQKIIRGRKTGEFAGAENPRLLKAAAKYQVPVEWWAGLTQKQRDYYPRWSKRNPRSSYRNFAAA